MMNNNNSYQHLNEHQALQAAMLVQRHILPYSPSPYVALALRLHRLVVSEVNPWAFFKLVDKAAYRLALWLQFLFPRMRYLYLTRIVSASGIFCCYLLLPLPPECWCNERHHSAVSATRLWLDTCTNMVQQTVKCDCPLQLPAPKHSPIATCLAPSTIMCNRR